MNALVSEIYLEYGNQIRRSGRDCSGYCVGGAVLHHLDDEIDWRGFPYRAEVKEGDLYIYGHDTEVARSDQQIQVLKNQTRFPFEDMLVYGLMEIVGHTNRDSSISYYAENIIHHNDSGDFDSSWRAVSDLFDEFEVARCGECESVYRWNRPDGRAQAGMKCSGCAYG